MEEGTEEAGQKDGGDERERESLLEVLRLNQVGWVGDTNTRLFLYTYYTLARWRVVNMLLYFFMCVCVCMYMNR